MAPNKRQRSIKKAGASSQAPPQNQWTSYTSTNAQTQGNVPYPLGLTNPEHIARYNCLSERIVVVARYYDEELLGRLGLLDDIRRLFARGVRGTLLK